MRSWKNQTMTWHQHLRPFSTNFLESINFTLFLQKEDTVGIEIRNMFGGDLLSYENRWHVYWSCMLTWSPANYNSYKHSCLSINTVLCPIKVNSDTLLYDYTYFWIVFCTFFKPFGKIPRICSTDLETGCKPVLLFHVL